MHEHLESQKEPVLFPYQRFYSDIYHLKDATGRLLAVKDLYTSLAGEGNEIDDERLRSFDIMHDIEDEENWRLATERLAMLPLVEFGGLMEEQRTPEMIQSNYATAIAFMKHLTQDRHDQQCLGAHSIGSYSCSTSESCPWRTTTMYCTGDAVDPDFKDIEYIFDRERYHRVVLARLNSLVGQGIESEEIIKDLRYHYYSAYNDHFDARNRGVAGRS